MKKKTGFYTGCHRFDHALSPMADGAVTYAYDAWGALRNPSTGEAYDTDAHAADKFYGKYDESTWFYYLDKMIDRTEIYACQVENMLRFEHNIPLRTHYAHSGVNVVAPVGFSAIPIYNSIYYRPKPYYPIYLNVF